MPVFHIWKSVTRPTSMDHLTIREAGTYQADRLNPPDKVVEFSSLQALRYDLKRRLEATEAVRKRRARMH